jgi:predicted RNA-binding Zn-ribbon protein involved in translation (DUF1610 family)
MAKCPKCGFEVTVSRKEWTIKPKTKPKAPAVKIAQFTCPKCGKTFRIYEKS